ncbi:hypothetical protein B0H19DRAFT_1082204 [Mycena capillaripes]|nr:hypothetical protein B0H19DRAFT_1082204 [Mycena capillaripes]
MSGRYTSASELTLLPHCRQGREAVLTVFPDGHECFDYIILSVLIAQRKMGVEIEEICRIHTNADRCTGKSKRDKMRININYVAESNCLSIGAQRWLCMFDCGAEDKALISCLPQATTQLDSNERGR